MGVVEFCEVKFPNNPDKVFYSGQILSGVVEIDLKEKLKVRKAYLTIQGTAKCQWTDTAKKTNSEEKTRKTISKFTGKQKYLNSVTNLIESDEEILPGKRHWSFMVELPAELPSSTKEKYGCIAYKVVVTFERPWKFNLEHTVDFTVIKPFALSSKMSLRTAAEQETTRTFLKGIFETNPLKAKIILPSTGFIPGQKINIKAELDNPTFFDVKYLRISLIKETEFKSQSPYEKSFSIQKKLEKLTVGQPFCRGNRKLDIEFPIPETVIPSIANDSCTVINVSYILRVKLKLLKGFKCPSVEFPIFIGTIPFADFPQPASSSTRPSAPALPPPPYMYAVNMNSPGMNSSADQSFNNSGGQIGFIVGN